MIKEISLIFLFIYLLVVAILDLKTKETPYFLSFSLIGAGLLANIVFILQTHNFELILNLILAFLISFFKYKFGLWGGGDFLVFIGTAFYLNLAFPFLGNILVFLISMYVATLVYNALYSLVLYFKERLFSKYELIFLFALLFFIYMNKFFIAFSIFLIWLLLVVYKLDLWYFTKKTPVNKLREEDWLAYDVYKNDELVVKAKDYPEGIDKEVIKKLKEKGVKFVYVKDGIPYLPTFFLALIFTYLFYEKKELLIKFAIKFIGYFL